MEQQQLNVKSRRTNIVCSICCLLQLLLPAEALDGSIQHEVLFHGDFWPQNVKLGAYAQVLSDGCHAVLDAHAVDHSIACKSQSLPVLHIT